MRSNPKLIAAIVLMALGAGLSARQWVRTPRSSAGDAGPGAAVCTATGAPGGRCDLPSGRGTAIAGVPVAALGVGFFSGVAALLLLALLGSPTLQRQVATLAFRVIDPTERRMLLGGWALATTLVVLAVGMGELWLRQQSRAQDLQATLNDPAKRDEYDAQRAVAKFQAGAVVTFALSGAPRLGAADGPIVVVEYVDYLCPFCRQLYGGLDQYLAQQNGRVSWYFKNLPLDTECNPTLPENLHPGACWMARGAVCAQGAGKWVEFYRAAFTAQIENPGPRDVTRLGTRLGLDRASYERCLRSRATIAVIAADVAESIRNKAQGTPTLFINGRRAPLWTYIERLVTAENERLARKPR